MGQVPHQTISASFAPPARFLVIGDGRLARHLTHYFTLLSLSFLTWSRSAERRGEVPALGEYLQAEAFTHALLAISDGAIDPFLRAQPALQRLSCVHFSGALATPLCPSAHPLMTFGEAFYELERYREIPFVLEKEGPGFAELLPGLPNPSYAITREAKPLYHALCVLSGNFTTLLWQKLFTDFETKLGLPPEVALPYLQACLANLERPGGGTLTGPLARGDQTTLKRNLDALEGDPFQNVYRAFVDAYASTNPAKGRGGPAT